MIRLSSTLVVHAEAQARRVDARFGREQALRQLLARHLQREHGDLGVLADGGVAGEVQHQRRLTDTGAGGDDDEVGRVEAAEDLVEVAEAGADVAAVGHAAFGVRRVQEGVEEVADVGEVA